MTTHRPPGRTHPTALDTQQAPVELCDITIAFARPGRPALVITRGLHLRLLPGRMHCIAGRSGSGKTSIITVAAGLARPDSGLVRWNDIDLADLSDDDITRRRRDLIGYTDQQGNLLDGLSALENILIPAVPDRRTHELQHRALTLLDRFGLSTRAGHRPEALSGGERQRVSLARALLLNPPVIIADEPTAGLDRATADDVIDELADRAANGAAVLVASHDPHLIDRADTRTQLEQEQPPTGAAAHPGPPGQPTATQP